MKIIQAVTWAGLAAWAGLVVIWWAWLTEPISAPQQAAAAGQALVLLVGPYIFVRAVGECLNNFSDALKPTPWQPPKRRKTNPVAAPDAEKEEA